MDDEEKEDGERVSLVILSLPSRRWDTLEERFDLSPLCPANKRDNFSNLNRTPFESTGWNELEEHHYVKQIYPRARRGVTWFRWKKKGEFFVFGRGRKIFLVFILFLSNPSYSLSKFEEVWEDLLLLIWIRNTSSFGKEGFICLFLNLITVWRSWSLYWIDCIILFEEENDLESIHGSKFLKITWNFNFKFGETRRAGLQRN